MGQQGKTGDPVRMRWGQDKRQMTSALLWGGLQRLWKVPG